MSLKFGQLKEAHATQNIDKVRILNSIALSRLGTCDFELLQSYPAGDPNFQRVDEALASHFALSSWYGFVVQGRCTELLATAEKADVGRKIVQLSLTGCQNFSDHELDVLIQSLPAELRVLRLDLGFSGLETLDMFTSTVQCLKSLVQLKLRFTGSSHFRTAAGLGVALREMESLMYLELWCAELWNSSHIFLHLEPTKKCDFQHIVCCAGCAFFLFPWKWSCFFDFSQLPRSSGCRFMNLPCLEEFGCFSSALQSSRNLESIVIDLSGCGQVSIDARMELHQSIKSLKWLRSSLDTWVNIEGLPKQEWFPRFAHVDFGGVCKARCTGSFRFIWQRMRQLSARQLPHVSSVYFEPTRFGRSSATSSDESAGEDAETETYSTQQEMFDEGRPFPCSHPSCHSFHSSESGYCERHRWSGLFKRICVVGTAWRQNVELLVCWFSHKQWQR